jgi:hypothetical protein
MITVLMGRTSSQSEIDLPSASYHRAAFRSDSMIDDHRQLVRYVASRRRGWLGVGSFLVITRATVSTSEPALQDFIGRSTEPYPARISGTSTNGHVGILPWVLYLLLRNSQSAESEVTPQVGMIVRVLMSTWVCTPAIGPETRCHPLTCRSHCQVVGIGRKG